MFVFFFSFLFFFFFFNLFNIYAQNIDCGYALEPPRRSEAVLTSTHNLFLDQQIESAKYIQVLPPTVLLYKVGYHGDMHFTDMFS